jgi:hypothetical protein
VLASDVRRVALLFALQSLSFTFFIREEKEKEKEVEVDRIDR